MKFIGAALLWSAFLMTGIALSKRYSLRCTVFDELVALCSGIHNRIYYTMQPLEEILNEICGEGCCKNLTFIYLLKEYLTADDFPSAWKRAVNSSDMPLTEKERDAVKSFGLSLGKSDREVQLNIVGYYKEFFSNNANNALKKKEKYEKATLLGWCLCGSAIMIIFI